MPERPRGYDDAPAEVRFGLISQANYDALLEAMERKDFNAWGRLAVELCEDNVPLFGVLFLRKHAMPHIWKEWARIQRNPRILVRLPRGHGKTDSFTFCSLVHRICYSVIPNSKHEDPRVLAIFETRPRANVRMLSIRQVFETGGPGGFIGKIFRGAATFPGGEPTPWADMSIPQIAERFGEWNNTNINLPHPRRLAKPDPNIASISPGEGSVGFQPRLIIADDVVGPKTAASATKRRALSKWWNDAIGPMLKGYTRLWGPHTVFHPEDLNFELGRKDGAYDLMEMKALDRFPDRDDFEVVRDERGVIQDIRLTPKGETLVPLWGCPEYTEAECPWRDPKHVDPNEGGVMHRPVKDLIMRWLENPSMFASQYMHVIRNTDSTSVKEWMLRFFCEDPNCPDRCWGKVASWHTEWDNWLIDQPDAGLDKHAPAIVLFNKDGVTNARGEETFPIERAVHGWDLAFGKRRTNDRTVCCRLFRTTDKRFFALYQKGQWKHDQVWRMVVLNAVTDPIRKPQEVGLEVDTEQIYPQEVRKLMRAMNVADRFKLTEIHRTQDKDIVLHNSGLPITMSNGFFYVNIHDEDAIMELLSVTPDQNGGHDDVLDASVNAYGRLRSAGKLSPGSLGTPLPAR